MRMSYERGLTGETTLPDFAVDPYRTPCPVPVDDPRKTGRCHGAEVDRNRLELHALLTVAGVPPHPEDRRVIEHLAQLGGTGATTILRWLRPDRP